MLNYLKQGTETLHREVEKSNLAKYILDHSITLELYKKLLIQNYHSYLTIEEQLGQNIAVVNDNLQSFIDTEKSDKLWRDIKGISSFAQELNPIETNFFITSEAEAIGALYVIEGSMLGGLLISKHLQQCESLQLIKTHHFFKSNPKNSMKRWKNFSETVNNIKFSDGDREKAIVSAQKSFLIFKNFQEKI